MKGYIKGFGQFLTESIDYDADSLAMLFDLGLIGPTAEQVALLNSWVRAENWKFDPRTGLINVEGSVYCSNLDLMDFEGIRFGKVSEHFYCHGNQLTSLEGAPQWVGEFFNCSANALTSLEGGPKQVGGHYYCHGNQLTSLEGAPQEINRNFYCSRNQLTNLEGAPQRVDGDFDCSHNGLKSLQGAPKWVGGDFECNNNKLTSLAGAPHIGKNLIYGGNWIENIENLPISIGGKVKP